MSPEIRLTLRARGRMAGLSRAFAVNTRKIVAKYGTCTYFVDGILGQNIKATFTRTQPTNLSAFAIIMYFFLNLTDIP